MKFVLRKPMTMAQFLDWEERQEARYEFDGVQPVAMTGGSFAHETIGANLRFRLQNHLQHTLCRALGPTMKIEVAGNIRYPDAFVFGTPVPRDERVIRDSIIVFEVLNLSTSRTDRILKLRDYQATPSIQRYIILEQDSIGAMVFARAGESWTAYALKEGDTLEMPEIGTALPLSEIYGDLDLPLVDEAT